MWSRSGCMCCKAAGSYRRATKVSRWSSSEAATVPSAMPHDRLEAPSMNAVVDFPVKPETRPYLDAFGRDGRGRGEPDWLAAQRQLGLARFSELGFSSRRSEAWRYLDR